MSAPHKPQTFLWEMHFTECGSTFCAYCCFFFNPSKRYCSQVFFFECQLFQVSPVRKNYETFCARGSALKSGSWRDSVWESIAPFPQLNQPVTASWSTHQTSHPLIKVTATQTLSTDASNCQRLPHNLTHCGQPVSMLVRFFATEQNMAMMRNWKQYNYDYQALRR